MVPAIFAIVAVALTAFGLSGGKVELPGDSGEGGKTKAKAPPRAARKMSAQDSFLEGEKAGAAKAKLAFDTEQSAKAARQKEIDDAVDARMKSCLLYTSPSPRD